MKPKPSIPLTVMVVDQHEEVCHRLGRGLEAHDGIHVVSHTTDLMVAGEMAHQYRPDAILADFNFGPTDRADIARWLRGLTPDSVLIVYSSYYLDDELQRFEDAGANRCLLKGLTLKELDAEIHQTVAAARTARLRTSSNSDKSGDGAPQRARKSPGRVTNGSRAVR